MYEYRDIYIDEFNILVTSLPVGSYNHSWALVFMSLFSLFFRVFRPLSPQPPPSIHGPAAVTREVWWSGLICLRAFVCSGHELHTFEICLSNDKLGSIVTRSHL